MNLGHISIVKPLLQTLAKLPDRVVQAAGAPERVGQLREEVRDGLVLVRESLAAEMTERDVYAVLFPLVVYADEVAQLRLPRKRGGWESLQREFFDTDAGGELFFAALDEALATDLANTLIYELHLFALGLGFQGKHVGDDEALADYTRRLREKLGGQPIEGGVPAGRPLPGRLESRLSPAWYYGAAALLIAVVWLVGVLFAAQETGRVERELGLTEQVVAARGTEVVR